MSQARSAPARFRVALATHIDANPARTAPAALVVVLATNSTTQRAPAPLRVELATHIDADATRNARPPLRVVLPHRLDAALRPHRRYLSDKAYAGQPGPGFPTRHAVDIRAPRV